VTAGRGVLVTGGSRGIGAAIARAFAARGDRVAVHCRDAVAAAEAVRDGLPGEGHAVVRADMADAEAVRAMVCPEQPPEALQESSAGRRSQCTGE